MTLWRKEKLDGTVDIEYDAMVVVQDSTDRLSDLNCFWMATDPLYPDNIMRRAKSRNGVFKNCYSLRQYYLGYGGNYNSTTRFRRYPGDEVKDGKVDFDNTPVYLTAELEENKVIAQATTPMDDEGSFTESHIKARQIADYLERDKEDDAQNEPSRPSVAEKRVDVKNEDRHDYDVDHVGDRDHLYRPQAAGKEFLHFTPPCRGYIFPYILYHTIYCIST